MEFVNYLPLAVLVILTVLGSWFDFKSRIIPNWLVGITFLGGLVTAFWLGGVDFLVANAAHSLIALLIGFALFALKFWGAGDGKLYAAVAAWLPYSDAFLLAFSISAVGLVLFIGFFLRYWGKLFRKDAVSIPYGVAIGLGASLAFARTAL